MNTQSSQNRLAALVAAALSLSAAALPAAPVNYADTHGDQVGSTNKARDIWSATIDNDASNLIITIFLDPGANLGTSNFNFGVGITTGPGASGDLSTNPATHGNAYNRAISIDSSLGGMTDWIGMFPAGGAGTTGSPFTSYGFNDYTWSSAGGAWTRVGQVLSGQGLTSQPGNTTPSEISVAVPMADLANLGLAPGSTFMFDIYSTGTGAGQTAYDSLADAVATNGPGGGGGSATAQYNGTALLSYTVQSVPEPMGLTLAAPLLLALRRRR